MCKQIDVERLSALQREQKPRVESTALIQDDALALFTRFSKYAVVYIQEKIAAFKTTKSYRILTATTQPAHLVVMLSIFFVVAAIYPAREGATSSNTNNRYYKFLYAAATAAHFGSQIWMTFISGLSLYFTLPRHDFGEVQKVLFPIYFAFTGILSAASIASHAKLFGVSWTTTLLVICFMVEILVRVQLCDPLVSLIVSKNEVEAKHGLGREIGKLAKDSELFSTPSYAVLHSKFRRLHMTIAMANMTCIGLSTLHIWLALQECETC